MSARLLNLTFTASLHMLTTSKSPEACTAGRSVSADAAAAVFAAPAQAVRTRRTGPKGFCCAASMGL